jgi:hypothetical protein
MNITPSKMFAIRIIDRSDTRVFQAGLRISFQEISAIRILEGVIRKSFKRAYILSPEHQAYHSLSLPLEEGNGARQMAAEVSD